MPENRNFIINTPAGGTNLTADPSTADIRNCIFKSLNVIAGKKRGYSTFGNRDAFGSDETQYMTTDTEYLTIGGDHITIGGNVLCFSRGKVVAVSGDEDVVDDAISIAESDLYYRDRKLKIMDNYILFSRVHEYNDFDIGADIESTSRAVLIQPFESPQKSDKISCVIPYNDRCCWIFTTRSLWLLIGDPINGNMQPKSYDIGTWNQHSADVTDAGEVYFLSRDGLCSCGLEGKVTRVSTLSIPGKLLDSINAMVAFDDLRGYVYARSGSELWCLEVESKAFWEFSVSSLPFRKYHSDTGELKFVCDDNAIRYFRKNIPSSETWSVVFGPYSIAQGFRTAVVHEIQSFLNAGSCNLEVITDKTANLCLAKAIDFIGHTGSYTEGNGFNNVHRPRKRGAWFCVLLQGLGEFEMERITVMSKMKGRLR